MEPQFYGPKMKDGVIKVLNGNRVPEIEYFVDYEVSCLEHFSIVCYEFSDNVECKREEICRVYKWQMEIFMTGFNFQSSSSMRKIKIRSFEY